MDDLVAFVRAQLDAEEQALLRLPAGHRWTYASGLRDAIILLAQPYAGRPGWQEAWSVSP